MGKNNPLQKLIFCLLSGGCWPDKWSGTARVSAQLRPCLVSTCWQSPRCQQCLSRQGSACKYPRQAAFLFCQFLGWNDSEKDSACEAKHQEEDRLRNGNRMHVLQGHQPSVNFLGSPLHPSVSTFPTPHLFPVLLQNSTGNLSSPLQNHTLTSEATFHTTLRAHTQTPAPKGLEDPRPNPFFHFRVQTAPSQTCPQRHPSWPGIHTQSYWSSSKKQQELGSLTKSKSFCSHSSPGSRPGMSMIMDPRSGKTDAMRKSLSLSLSSSCCRQISRPTLKQIFFFTCSAPQQEPGVHPRLVWPVAGTAEQRMGRPVLPAWASTSTSSAESRDTSCAEI